MDRVYWTHTLEDLQKVVELKIHYEVAVAYQTYESLVSVVSQIFAKPNNTTGAKEVTTFDELTKMFEDMTKSG